MSHQLSEAPHPHEIARYLRENFGGFRLHRGLVIPPQDSVLVVTTAIPVYSNGHGENPEVAFIIAPGVYKVSRNTAYHEHFRFYLETPKDEIAINLYLNQHGLIDWRHAIPISRCATELVD